MQGVMFMVAFFLSVLRQEKPPADAAITQAQWAAWQMNYAGACGRRVWTPEAEVGPPNSH